MAPLVRDEEANQPGVRAACDSKRLIRVKDGLSRSIGAFDAERTGAYIPSSAPCYRGGQGRGRTADLPLFRIKDHRAGLATMVFLPAQGSAMHLDRRWCSWMYETRNETAQISIHPARCTPGHAVRATALGALLGAAPWWSHVP